MTHDVEHALINLFRRYLFPYRLLPITFLRLVVFYLELFLFSHVVLWKRPELRPNFTTCILFSLYKIAGQGFRMFALLNNVLHYTTWRPKNKKIKERFEKYADLPPVPHRPNPDWYEIL